MLTRSVDPQSLTFTGAAPGDMSVALATGAIRKPASRVSAQVWWPATGAPVGTLYVDVSSDQVHWDTLDNDDAEPPIVHPAGTAGSATVEFESGAPFFRVRYVPTTGGDGAALAGNSTNPEA